MPTREFPPTARASRGQRQLTVTTKGNQNGPAFSRDGHYVYFASDSEFLENDPDHAFKALYRYDLTTSTIQRSGGLRFENLAADFYPQSVNNDGSVVAYTTFSDSIGKNVPDRNISGNWITLVMPLALSSVLANEAMT